MCGIFFASVKGLRSCDAVTSPASLGHPHGASSPLQEPYKEADPTILIAATSETNMVNSVFVLVAALGALGAHAAGTIKVPVSSS